MAVTYFPFDAGAGAAITEGTWQKAARRWLATGVIRSYLNTLTVTADGTTLGGSVASGGAWIEGFYYESDAAIAFTVGAAHATLGRIDRVILRLDRTANTITQAVLAGTAAASPVAPTLTVTDTLWEIGLATVLVDPAVGVIAANKVTDTRTLVQNGQRFVQGLAANLPAVRQQGLVYYATDTDVLYYDDGTATHIFDSQANANAAYPRKAAAWITGRAYVLEELVTSSGALYRVTTAHTSSGSFDATKFTAVGSASAFTGARAHRVAAVNIASGGGLTVVGLDGETLDTSNLHDNTTNNSRITLTTVGKWLVTGQLSFAANATGIRQALISRNTTLTAYQSVAATPTNATVVQVSDLVTASATTDYVELSGYQSSGATLAVGVGSNETWLSAVFLGA